MSALNHINFGSFSLWSRKSQLMLTVAKNLSFQSILGNILYTLVGAFIFIVLMITTSVAFVKEAE